MNRLVIFVLVLAGSGVLHGQPRALEPEDLFRFQRVGTIAWSSDRTLAAVEIHQPSRWLDPNIPTSELAVVDVASGTLQIVSPSLSEVVGFFRPTWSPDNRHLLFLSVDYEADVKPWVWTVGENTPVVLSNLLLRDLPADPPIGLWRDNEHVLLMVRDQEQPNNEGRLYFALQRGRNVADQWARAVEGDAPTVSVLDSVGPSSGGAMAVGESPQSRIVSVNINTQTVTMLATGALHQPRISRDGQTLTYRRENPPFASTPVSTFVGSDVPDEEMYDAVNWGTEIEILDLPMNGETGAAEAGPSNLPLADQPVLRVANSPANGTRLLLDRSDEREVEVWRGNEWVRDIQTGRAELVSYTSTTGVPLTGWILYPPDYEAGDHIPVVTIVYPGTVYGAEEPRDFSIFRGNFLHPQLLAAIGYGVVLPSMPTGETILRPDGLSSLTEGVLPLIDTLVDREIVDEDQVAIIGQSFGGWATLGLITQTNRFRTAIASAAPTNLTSLYGTFYGQYRYGDSGSPQRAQVLRILQFERGPYGAGAPPWERPEFYAANSPIHAVSSIETPVMLVHGEADFVPVQQAEEMFTGLYRQDKRVKLLRYTGEWHTISDRVNVLDLWRRIDDWLRETMPP